MLINFILILICISAVLVFISISAVLVFISIEFIKEFIEICKKERGWISINGKLFHPSKVDDELNKMKSKFLDKEVD